MLEVEIDVFSGMPNPTFLLTEKEESELLDRIVGDPVQMAPTISESEQLGLGYRGVIVRQIKPDRGMWSTAERPNKLALSSDIAALPGKYPTLFRLGTREGRGESVAEWLLKISERKPVVISDEVRSALQEKVALLPPRTDDFSPPDKPGVPDDGDTTRGADWWVCKSPLYLSNHAEFNRPENVARNNCYCFAANHLAGVINAKPGRHAGAEARDPIICRNIIEGLRADGWVDTCQTKTLTVALAIWPEVDYHFYRLVSSGPDWWWEHKIAGTPARWTDESNQSLRAPLSPVNCNRGRYRISCGYFYQSNDTAFVA
jgi:hypothetical protein